MPDFYANDFGSIVTIRPSSDAARHWAAANIDYANWQAGDSIAIEPCCFLDIAIGILSDGLTLCDRATGRMASLPYEGGAA